MSSKPEENDRQFGSLYPVKLSLGRASPDFSDGGKARVFVAGSTPTKRMANAGGVLLKQKGNDKERILECLGWKKKR